MTKASEKPLDEFLLGGVLAIYKGKIIFTVLLDMSKRHLYVLAFYMNNRIERFLGKIFLKKILQAIFRTTLAVVNDAQPPVQAQ